jgi:hypothetical protein
MFEELKVRAYSPDTYLQLSIPEQTQSGEGYLLEKSLSLWNNLLNPHIAQATIVCLMCWDPLVTSRVGALSGVIVGTS